MMKIDEPSTRQMYRNQMQYVTMYKFVEGCETFSKMLRAELLFRNVAYEFFTASWIFHTPSFNFRKRESSRVKLQTWTQD